MPIVASIVTSSTRAAAVRAALVAGLTTNVPAFYWLAHTIHVFGGFPIAVAVLFYGALSLYSSLQFVIFALAVRRTGFGLAASAPALAWVALEFLYPNLFPWRLANSQRDVIALLQIGEITGPYGLSFAMAWTSAAIASGWIGGWRKARAGLLGAAVAVAAVVAWGSARLPGVDAAMLAAPAVRAAVVQGNLGIEEKGDVRYFESNLATYRRTTREMAPRADVVIWPETVVTEPLPRSLARLPPRARATLGLERPLFTGALTYAGTPEDPLYYNSVILFDGDGTVLGMSDKQILMPFGEYMPFGSVLPWLKSLSPMTGDFQAGERVVVLEVPGSGRFAPLNCYEDLIASIARGATRDGAEVLFAVANDAWFGDTAAPFQHEALALWRAVENRRFLVRVTNTGVTDVIDAAGRVVLRLPVFEAAAAVAEVRRLATVTFYQRFGPVFAWLVVALAAAAAIAGRRGG